MADLTLSVVENIKFESDSSQIVGAIEFAEYVHGEGYSDVGTERQRLKFRLGLTNTSGGVLNQPSLTTTLTVIKNGTTLNTDGDFINNDSHIQDWCYRKLSLKSENVNNPLQTSVIGNDGALFFSFLDSSMANGVTYYVDFYIWVTYFDAYVINIVDNADPTNAINQRFVLADYRRIKG